jgi:TPR repeat protein
VPQDYGKAREWYEKGALAGNRLAKANLAKLLDQGKGGPTDFHRAAKLLLDAARSGNAAAAEMLRSDMKDWDKATRTELKRELARLGHYAGTVDESWDGTARASAAKYLGADR